MITAFALQEAGYVCNVSTQFLHLLRQLIEEILVVLDEPGELSTFVLAATEVETTRDEPHDPALGSLLPPMSDDPPEAANLRALTEDFLRAEKAARLRRIHTELSSAIGTDTVVIMVTHQEVWDWLAALNDVRLALAGELGIDSREAENKAAELAHACDLEQPLSEATMSAGMYMMVTWWQDSLLTAVREEAWSH